MMKKVFLAAVIASILVGCGGSGGGDSNGYSTGPTTPPTNNTPPATGSSVTVANNAFNPSAVSVARGSTVNWTWDACDGGYPAQTCVTHSVTFDDGTTSGTKESGTFSRTFTTAGNYNYHCTVHGTAMSGAVEVK